MEYQRRVIAVERRLGFLYVPAIGQVYMPRQTGKIEVKLEGEKQLKQLNYNADHKRIFGLTEWYKKAKVEVEAILNIKIEGNTITISVAKDSSQTETSIEKSKNLIDISGLSPVAKGNIVEDRIKELILLYGQGLMNVYKPVIDNGIDLIVMRDGVFTPIFIQVKSRFNAAKNENLLIEISDNTFTAHHSFYVLGASFNPATLELDDKILLIPSRDFEAKTKVTKDYNKRRVSVSLKERTKAQWAGYLISKTKLVEELLQKFDEMAKYIV